MSSLFFTARAPSLSSSNYNVYNDPTAIRFRWLQLQIWYQKTPTPRDRMTGTIPKYVFQATADAKAAPSKWCLEVDYVHSCHPDDRPLEPFRVSSNKPTYLLKECRNNCTIQFYVKFVNSNFSNSLIRFTDRKAAEQLYEVNCKLLFEDDPTEPLFVNREILGVYSVVFRRMFNSNFKEREAEEIPIKEIPREDFLIFLDCLIHPVKPITRQNLQTVFTLADRFECRVLMEQCSEFWKVHVPIGLEEFKNYITIASRYQFPDLLSTSLENIPVKLLPELLDPDFLDALQDPVSVRTVLVKAHSVLRKA